MELKGRHKGDMQLLDQRRHQDASVPTKRVQGEVGIDNEFGPFLLLSQGLNFFNDPGQATRNHFRVHAALEAYFWGRPRGPRFVLPSQGPSIETWEASRKQHLGASSSGEAWEHTTSPVCRVQVEESGLLCNDAAYQAAGISFAKRHMGDLTNQPCKGWFQHADWGILSKRHSESCLLQKPGTSGNRQTWSAWIALPCWKQEETENLNRPMTSNEIESVTTNSWETEVQGQMTSQANSTKHLKKG